MGSHVVTCDRNLQLAADLHLAVVQHPASLMKLSMFHLGFMSTQTGTICGRIDTSRD